ncbi:MAG: 4-hydroxythreonine-4-phosphate dehydrogenase PdxA [Candidatus Omnitrophica bacterium]|nr:4-hydroxythreonine-4-phosphate dehydrogenase PdxA [Candidatus Omnitrophota bacterium]
MPKLTSKCKRILLYSLGDPAGIGPEILVKSLAGRRCLNSAFHTVVADKRVVSKALSVSGLSLKLNVLDSINADQLKNSCLNIIDVSNAGKTEFGRPSLNTGRFSFQYLKESVQIIKRRQLNIKALITLPVSKELISNSVACFTGHTEYLQKEFKVKKVLMVFLTPEFFLYLHTRHIPLKNVANSIKSKDLVDSIEKIACFYNESMSAIPKIAVLGLNPHASDGGLIGDEESKNIIPAVAILKKNGLDISGPYPADGFFRNTNRKKYQIVVSMYHDQSLPVLKTVFDGTVNCTVGLPFLRLSPDHGPAYDIAGKGIANPVSLNRAVDYALRFNAL